MILIHRQYLSVDLLHFVDVLIDLFLGALFFSVLAPIFSQKGSIFCKSGIWDLGYTQGNVDAKNLDLLNVRKILCVGSSDIVKATQETLPATTIGMFPNFLFLPNCFTLVWEDLFLVVGCV